MHNQHIKTYVHTLDKYTLSRYMHFYTLSFRCKLSRYTSAQKLLFISFFFI